MKKLIVTTDDFGIIPTINTAIIEAVNKKKVNSVAAFSNYDGSPKYKSAMQNAKVLLDKTNGKVDIGCHLTITSGKPITGDKAISMCDDDGYFRQFTEFKRTIDLKALKNEMNEQIMRFKDADIPVNHLSCHHNALTLFPEIFDVYLKVCRAHKLAIRSSHSKPSRRYNLYLKILSLQLSDGDLNRSDRKEMRSFNKKVGDFFAQKSKGKVKTTSYFESRHYGPLPFTSVSGKNAKNILEKKEKKLKKIFSDFRKSDNDSMEIILHIAKDSLSRIKTYSDLDYPGIEPKYFDSRIMEYLSIMNFDVDQFPDVEMASWDDLNSGIRNA